MKKVLVTTVLALFGLAPAMSAACEYGDESSASTTPPEQFASAPKPVATKVPAPAVAKTLAPNAVKPVAAKVKVSAPEQKIAAGATN